MARGGVGDRVSSTTAKGEPQKGEGKTTLESSLEVETRDHEEKGGEKVIVWDRTSWNN